MTVSLTVTSDSLEVAEVQEYVLIISWPAAAKQSSKLFLKKREFEFVADKKIANEKRGETKTRDFSDAPPQGRNRKSGVQFPPGGGGRLRAERNITAFPGFPLPCSFLFLPFSALAEIPDPRWSL